MLEFIKGHPDRPTGNLLVFCEVHGKNPITPDGKLIVSNVVVSFVSASSNSFPVVIFPPDSLGSMDELERLVALNQTYDVIQLPDFEIPPDTKESVYLRERMEHLNQTVIEYVEYCRRHIDTLLEQVDEAMARGEVPPLPTLPPGEDRPRLPGPDERTEKSALDTLEYALEHALGNGVEEELKGDARVITDSGDTGGVEDAIQFLRINYPKYDVDRFAAVLRRPGKEAKSLARLYIRKFQAVFDERYEVAARLKHKIEKLEHSLFM